MTVFANRAAEGACWAMAIVLLIVYCGARSYGELERREAIALFTQAHVPPRAAPLDTERARGAPSGVSTLPTP